MKKAMLACIIFFNTCAFIDQETIEADITDFLNSNTMYRGDCSFSTQIVQVPALINFPGYYCVGTSLSLTNVAGTRGPAITIDVSANNSGGNVIIDLNDQQLSNTNRTSTGIFINGQANVIIRNGSLRNFDRAIVISNSGRVSENIVIDGVLFYQNNVAIFSQNSINCLISNCQISRSFGNGIFINQGTNSYFINCVAINNNSTGFFLNNVQTFQMINCKAYNNTNRGFLLQGVGNGIISNCQSNQNNDGIVITNVGGLTSNNIAFDTCNASDNTTSGFTINGIGNVLQYCQSSNNNQGILINGNGHTILNCLSNFNNNNGFLLQSGSSNCQVRNNTAIGNTNGFSNQGTNNHLYSNFANDNTSNFLGITNFVVTPTAMENINFTANIAE